MTEPETIAILRRWWRTLQITARIGDGRKASLNCVINLDNRFLKCSFERSPLDGGLA